MPTPRVLAVEDEEIVAALIDRVLTQSGFAVTVVETGEAAWQRLRDPDSDYSVILLDRGLPDMDGITLLQKLKAEPQLARIPVVMQTAAGDEEDVREGLLAGAYYYLVKPLKRNLLATIVTAALSHFREIESLRQSARAAERGLQHLDKGTFTIRTLAEARQLAHLLSGGFPNPDTVVFGLQELLVNAIEHGNLGIGYAEKSQLILDNAWEAEVERRLAMPDYTNKRVLVDFQRSTSAVSVLIADQGQGFDWSPYLDLDPKRAFDPHGRGIAMARMESFDRLEYLGIGNAVQVSVSVNAKPTHW